MENGNKKSLVIIIILTIFLTCAVAYIIVDKIFYDTDNIENNTSIKQKEDINYEIRETDVFAKTIRHSADYVLPIEDEEGNVRLSYPVIYGATDDIINLNSKISDNINNNIKEIVETESIGEQYSNVCYWAKIVETGENIGYEHFPYLNYEIIESDDYISIIEREEFYTECATPDSVINDVYIIDKNTKKVLSNIISNDILNSFKQYVISYIESNYYDTKEEMNNTLEDSINNNTYKAYYNKNNKLTITYPAIIESSEVYKSFQFDGTNWSEYFD